MHFALPPRKTSSSSPYHGPRPAQSTAFMPRRSRLRVYAWPLAAVIGVILLISLLRQAVGGDSIPLGTPPVVLVTTFDQQYGASYEKIIKENRIDYATRHGYATFFPNVTDYDLNKAPISWAKVPALRHAMTLFPHSTWFFYLDQHALFMRPDLSVDAHITSKARLEHLMIPDMPVVPPDSVIHTLKSRNHDRVELVLTQDHEGLGQHSMLVKRGEWAWFFLDSWFDPLYRSYSFQRAEGHALEHLVQWHGTVLTRIALVPQKIMNSYTRGEQRERYEDGDYIAHFHGCDLATSGRSCEQEALPLFEHAKSLARAAS